METKEEGLRKEFLSILSQGRKTVPLQAKQAPPSQVFHDKVSKLDLAGLVCEHLSLHSEVGLHQQGHIPLLIIKRTSHDGPASGSVAGPQHHDHHHPHDHHHLHEHKPVDVPANERAATTPGLPPGVPETSIKQPRQRSPPPGMPAIVFLHMTGGCKETMLRRMLPYARSGFVTCAMDCRYHGERAVDDDGNLDTGAYPKALVRAWHTKPVGDDSPRERPFLFDNVWDLSRLVDYLSARPDVDPQRIGMTGISLGGMHTWLACATDPRIAAGVALIGVQSFSYGVEHDCWQARVASIPDAFMAAAREEGKERPAADTVRKVFSHIAPGLLDRFDAPSSLPCIAPRPLLVLNGEDDPRCPIAGVRLSMQRALEAYARAGAPENIKLQAFPGVAHEATKEMDDATSEWLHRHLLQRAML